MDDEFKDPILTPVRLAPPGDIQISLKELFFVMTAVAVEMGVYLHVSKLLAFLAAGYVILAAAIRFADIHSFILGSIVGYVVAALVVGSYALTCATSPEFTIAMFLFIPACGYLLGALLAVNQAFS